MRGGTVSVEENKSLARRYFDDLWTGGDEEFIDRHVAVDYVFHDANTPGGVRGTDGLRRYYWRFRAGFPDMRFTVEDQVAEGDKVVTRWSVEATQSGPFLGMPPSDKTLHVTGINIFRFVDGYFVEGWHNLDTLGLLQQLGAVPDH
jgi:steroid delta-isomerase-like uncharacterized protein